MSVALADLDGFEVHDCFTPSEGASGVRMLVDAAKQVRGEAGDYQVEGAKTFGTLNFGGSTATTVSFVVGATEEA